MDNKGYTTTTIPPPIYTTQPPLVVVGGPIMGRFSQFSMQMQCPSCRAAIATHTISKPGLLTWLICGGLCLAGCWLGCQFIPFCIDECQDVDHFCPMCNAFFGSYRRI